MAGNEIDGAMLRELCATMLHDLRNPLAAIMTNLEFARRTIGEPGPDQDLVEAIRDSAVACEVLRRIVSNFDVLVRAPHVATETSSFGVAQVVSEVARRCESRAEQSGLRLEVDDRSGRASARADRTLFALAVENLVANSIQHAPRETTIRLEVSETAAGIVVAVADDGAAVPEPLRELAVSAAGQRPQDRQAGSRYGRGLGLWAAGVAAAASGAVLEFGDRGGKSRMMLTLPP
jgi:two-component system heavy metal sensor histidine kinase CusS